MSPLNWNTDRLYSNGYSSSGSYRNGSNGSVTGGANGSNTGSNTTNTNSSNADATLQLIDCLNNLATGSSSHNNTTNTAYQLMAVDECPMQPEGANTKNGFGPQPPPPSTPETADMLLIGSDQRPTTAAVAHNYTDLYKIQQTQPTTTSTSPTVSSKVCYTSLDKRPGGGGSGSLSTAYFKSTGLTLMESRTVHDSGSESTNNNNNNSSNMNGTSNGPLDVYGSTLRTQGLSMDNSYVTLGKIGPQPFNSGYYDSTQQCFEPDYDAGFQQGSYYSYNHQSQQAPDSLASLGYPSMGNNHVLDVEFDPMHSAALDCDVDQVIRHELNMDGSLDFTLSTSDGSNGTTGVANNGPVVTATNYDVLQPEQPPPPQPQQQQQQPQTQQPETQSQQSAQEPNQTSGTTLMDISSFSAQPATQQPQPATASTGPYFTSNSGSSQQTVSYVTLNNRILQQQHSSHLQQPQHIAYSQYGKYIPVNHYLPVPNSSSASSVMVDTATAAAAVTVTSVPPATANSHHQPPVASRSWVH